MLTRDEQRIVRLVREVDAERKRRIEAERVDAARGHRADAAAK